MSAIAQVFSSSNNINKILNKNSNDRIRCSIWFASPLKIIHFLEYKFYTILQKNLSLTLFPLNFPRQGTEWYHLRTKLTPNLTSRKVLNALIPALNEICDDLVELIKFKRDKDQLINNFEDIANSFGLEGNLN